MYSVKDVIIDVKENFDQTDLRCGGPRILGFDLVVDADDDDAQIEKWARSLVKRYGLPCMRVTVGDPYWTPYKPNKRETEGIVKEAAPGMAR